MNSKELQLIVKCGETSTVQFKERFSNQDSIAAEMVAMSNARGGMILFGIRDKTGEIIGLSYQEIQQINSMKISINIKRQAMKLLRKVSIQKATTNNKPLIHSNQSQTTL